LVKLVKDLLSAKERESAMAELSKRRESIENLAVVLWDTYGVIPCLVQEFLSIYPLLNPPALTTAASNRACNALALLQCIAAHDATRDLFLEARLPLYLYPFLNTTSKTKPFEYIRLTSLGVIGALVRNDSVNVVEFLLKTEIIPLCLRILDIGTELSKTVSLFIIQKIAASSLGISYIMANGERLDAICTVLVNILVPPFDGLAVRVVKHAIKCLHTLSFNGQCCEYLRRRFFDKLKAEALVAFVAEDAQTSTIFEELMANLNKI
jgi:CCR4-NOT transcription complex subunit 9